MKEFREGVLKYGSYFLIFIIPLLFWGTRAFPYISSKTFFFYGAVEILAGFWIYSMITDRAYRLPKKVWLWFIPIFAFVGWMTVTAIAGAHPALSFWSSLIRGTGLLTWYHAIVFALVFATLIRRYGMAYWYAFFRWMVLGAGILGASIWFGPEGFNVQAHVFKDSGGGGLMGNSSFAAAYMVFSLFLGALLLATKDFSRAAKSWVGAAMAAMVFSPVFINLVGLFNGRGIIGSARGALLGIAVGLGFAGLAYLVLSQKRALKWLGVAGMVLGVAIFAVGWSQLETPGTKLHERFIQATSETRFIFWDVSKRAIRDNPVLGYGPETYMVAFQHYFNPRILQKTNGQEGWTDRPHNIIYETGVSGGYPAIALYVVFIGSIFFGLYLAVRKGMLGRKEGALLGGLVTGYVFQNLFIFDSALSWMALFLVAGVVYALQEEVPQESALMKENKGDGKGKIVGKAGVRMSPFLKNSIAIALVGVFAVSWVFFAYLPSRKASAYQRVFGATVNKDYQKLLKGSPVGTHWDVGGFAHDTYNLFASNPQAIKNNKQVLPVIAKDLDGFLEYLEIIAQKNTTDFRLYMSMVHLYSTKVYLLDIPNDPVISERMLALLARCRELAPNNPEVYWGIAQVKAWSNDLPGVIQAYRDSIALDPSVSASHQLLISFLRDFGYRNEHRAALAEAKKQITDFPGIMQSYRNAISIDPKLPVPHLRYLDFLKDFEFQKEYDEALLEARKYIPDFRAP